MQSEGHPGVYSSQVPLAFPNYSFERDGWFPSDPDCPNHEKDVPFSAAYADPNVDGQVSCTHCFFHSRIMQSMAMECSHLHACATCTNCYSPNDGQSPNQASSSMSPPMIPASSPYGMGLSPPLVHQGSPQVQPLNLDAYRSTPPIPSCNNVPKDAMSNYRRLSLPIDYHQSNVNQPRSYSSPSTPHQITPNLIATERLTETVQMARNNSRSSDFSKPFPSQGSSQSLPSNTNSLVTQQSEMENLEPSISQSTTNKRSTSERSTKAKHETVPNRKRGANDVCEVCGDRASGYHYNALTCEGCKGFFRRSINKKELPYSCKFGGACEMDTYTRRKCPDCRLKKCKAVGMLEECLLTEIQCRSKRRSRKTKTNKSSDKDVTESPAESVASLSSSSSTKTTPSSDQSREDALTTIQTKELTAEIQQKNLIEFVGKAFEAYRSNPEIVKRWASYLDNSATKSHLNLCEMATVHVQVLVEFTKKLPGFLKVCAEDQIALLKGSVVEIMLLRNSRGYNLKRGDIDMSMIVKDTGLNEAHFRTLLDFFARVDNLKLDDTEYGLLAAIILFDSDHCESSGKAGIDRYRDRYISAMKTYSETKEPKRTQIVAKILNLITELRTLYDAHSKLVTKMREKNRTDTFALRNLGLAVVFFFFL